MPIQLSMFEPHTLARKSDPSTSHAAAARVGEFRKMQHDTILRVLRHRGQLTAFDIAAFCALDAHEIGKRLSEMERVGLIRVVLNEGRIVMRLAPSGRQARVWAVA